MTSPCSTGERRRVSELKNLIWKIGQSLRSGPISYLLDGSAGRLTLAIISDLIAFWIAPSAWSWTLRALAAWSVGATVYLAIAWSHIFRADPDTTRCRCRRDDAYRGTVDALLLAASLASVGAVCLALSDSHPDGGSGSVVGVGIPILSVVLAWLLVHTLYAMHYARLFYQSDDDPNGPPRGGFDLHEADGGPPDYRDFLYIAIAVACTFGVTDTELTSKRARRAVAKHSLLSFAFATIVLALAVNVVTNLLSRGR